MIKYPDPEINQVEFLSDVGYGAGSGYGQGTFLGRGGVDILHWSPDGVDGSCYAGGWSLSGFGHGANGAMKDFNRQDHLRGLSQGSVG